MLYHVTCILHFNTASIFHNFEQEISSLKPKCWHIAVSIAYVEALFAGYCVHKMVQYCYLLFCL